MTGRKKTNGHYMAGGALRTHNIVAGTLPTQHIYHKLAIASSGFQAREGTPSPYTCWPKRMSMSQCHICKTKDSLLTALKALYTCLPNASHMLFHLIIFMSAC
jgi:hypothetical protein